jgi:hypothetical protein
LVFADGLVSRTWDICQYSAAWQSHLLQHVQHASSVQHRPIAAEPCLHDLGRCEDDRRRQQAARRGGYMVCTSDYVATNTRKTKEGCKKFSGRQAVTQRRPTPRKPLCVRHDTWLCRQNRQSHHTQCKFYVGSTSDRLVQTVSVTANHTLCSIAGGLNSSGRSWPAMT